MSTLLNEVVIHLNESVDEATLARIEDDIRLDRGVVSVGHRPNKNHLMMMVYDTELAPASSVLHNFKERGLHAQLIGL